MLQVGQQIQHPHDPDHARQLRGRPGLCTLNCSLGDTGLASQFGLGKGPVNSTLADTRTELGKNGVIRKQFTYLHNRHL